MSIYLNTKRPLENFKELYDDNYFVDKSELISALNEKISTKGKYVCITRPRRFGKSSVADMLGTYYLKAVDSKYIFNNNLFVENQNDFLEFLRNLLKDQPYVALAYMTGVLPIKKHSSTSALNMFEEYTFLKDRIFDE
ncbi:hypothetical protein psyc5s11_50640 [Clostridium gelidum]|uniref:AAA-ATPase-like domain-containing protein n=1 Tax=Clostridium gelidum TaxID=704125 RepID=A0ABN6J3T9_9CLOT|nr:hypothetical protein psyc5s11_50640 [Clostridium gelidum]